LLTAAQRDAIEIVLVRPRNPLNIGAAARAMANFGFARLAVVAPYAPNWREARSAVGAPELLKNAQQAATLAEAISGCTLVAGTGTFAHRKPDQRVVRLPELPELFLRDLERGGQVALVFGPEKHGLTREDLSWCHLLVEIPTDPRQPSMNLGQAVAVCLYELTRGVAPFSTSKDPATEAFPHADSTADSGVLDILAGAIEETMVEAGYSPAIMRDANRLDLRLLLRRLAFKESDSRRALRLFRRVLWRLRHTDENGKPSA
jgi:tRNA/rRNA methyltransferase